MFTGLPGLLESVKRPGAASGTGLARPGAASDKAAFLSQGRDPDPSWAGCGSIFHGLARPGVAWHGLARPMGGPLGGPTRFAREVNEVFWPHTPNKRSADLSTDVSALWKH